MKEQVFVSAIMHVKNDEATVKDSLLKVDTYFASTFEHYEIIVVNNNSTDRTLQQIREAQSEIQGNFIIINLSRNHGIEQAMMAGLYKSMGDFVYEIESSMIDFSDEVIRQLHQTAITGYDIVSASTGKPASIKSRLFYALVNRISYLDMSLGTEHLRIVSRRALNAMLSLKEKVRYRKALYAYTGYGIERIEYTPLFKHKGKNTKLNRENITTAVDVIVSFSNIGLRLSHYMSLLFFIFSVLVGGYSLYNKIFNKNVVDGWTTIMVFVAMGFAGLFFIIGVIGEYIYRMMIEIQNRPVYSTKSVEMYKEKDNLIPFKTPIHAAKKEIERAVNEVAVGNDRNHKR
jgi:polyisoprenyl-phosphate glycosyltransferase